LALMLAIPLLEIVLRPLFGQGIENAPLLVQHLGLVLAMFGALLAERGQHLSSLGSGFAAAKNPALRLAAQHFARASSALLCGMLAQASWTFVASEMEAPRDLAYGLPGWVIQAAMPLGFLLLGLKIAARMSPDFALRLTLGLALPLAGWLFAGHFDGSTLPLWPFALWLGAILFCGAPIFAVLGGLALALFWQEGQPWPRCRSVTIRLRSIPRCPPCRYLRWPACFSPEPVPRHGSAPYSRRSLAAASLATAIAAAVLCSFFTAFTGGSGVTILALGGLLLPLLSKAGFPEKRGISLVTSASALGVLIAPSVPLIMYAIIARVPIDTMFLAGLLPALVMVACLLLFGGYLNFKTVTVNVPKGPDFSAARTAAWNAKWEILAPFVAIGSLVGGVATPTESAALTALYALLTQSIGAPRTGLAAAAPLAGRVRRGDRRHHGHPGHGARADQFPDRCRHSRCGD
jgi:C4-dicarboxylate transporter DctM subunit